MPSSLIKAQLRVAMHIPVTGANPTTSDRSFGNIYFNWPKLFHTFTDLVSIGTPIQSFHISRLYVKLGIIGGLDPIGAKYSLLENFQKSVKRIIVYCHSFGCDINKPLLRTANLSWSNFGN